MAYRQYVTGLKRIPDWTVEKDGLGRAERLEGGAGDGIELLHQAF